MNKFFLPFCILALASLASCGGSGNQPKNDSAGSNDSTAKAAAADTIPAEFAALAKRFPESGKWPFVTDSASIDGISEITDSLRTADVQLLAAGMIKDDLTNSDTYLMTQFYKIDSLKSKNAYSKYCETLDLGMTKDAKAYPVAQLKFENNQRGLVWGVYTGSYEACPYSTEKAIFITMISGGKAGDTYLLGRQSSAADAPVWMTDKLYAKLENDGKLSMNNTVESDEGEGTIETTKNAYEAQFLLGKIGKVSKKSLGTTKRKSPNYD